MVENRKSMQSAVRRAIPSLSALTVFEAAARTKSFTAAAQELNVTQAAVSRRIRALEETIGSPLFDRANRRVQLTDAGGILLDATNDALASLGKAIRGIGSLLDDDSLTIGASLAFSHFVLLPALAEFRDSHEELVVRVVSQDTWSEQSGWVPDVLVQYGKPPFPGYEVLMSLPDSVIPTCAPSFAEKHGLDPDVPLSSDMLSRLPRISSNAAEIGWLDWDTWSKAMHLPDLTRPASLHVTNYSDAAYAAMNGEGIMLGWSCLLSRPLADGRLMTLGDISKHGLVPDNGHHFLTQSVRNNPVAVDAFEKWVVQKFSRLAAQAAS